jgi:Protein of unknown function (DUF1501)
VVPNHPSGPSRILPLFGRRDLLRVSAAGIAASLVPDAWLAAAPRRDRSHGTARSVILLWMAGGVTHIDSFDPKPDTSESIRGTLGAIATTVPGMHFCETLPCLARQAQHLAVVRSFAPDDNDHFLSQVYALSGRQVTAAQLTSAPNIGAIISRLHGGRAGLPAYIAVPGTTRPGPPPRNLFVGGWLGAQHAPFACGGKPRNEDFTAKVAEAGEEDFNQQALEFAADIDAGRLEARRSLRQRLETGLRARDQKADALGEQYRNAHRMLVAPTVRQAFELKRESNVVRDAYGRTKIGQRCLLARRLVEAGARFVMVDYGYDPDYGNLWDNHRVPEQNQPHICEIVKQPYHLAGMDRAFAALVSDLDERGLLAETLVVFLTEFGRTPQISKLGGRDHWGKAGSIFFAGGGTRGGQAIGPTDKQGAFPRGRAYSPGDVAATLYEAIGVDHTRVLHDPQNRPVPILPHGEAIPDIF